MHWALPAALLISSLFFPGCDRSQGRVPELCLNLVPAIAGMWMSVCIRVCMCVHAHLLRSCGCSMFWLMAVDCTWGLSVSYLCHCSDFILNCDILIKCVNKYIKIIFFLNKAVPFFDKFSDVLTDFNILKHVCDQSNDCSECSVFLSSLCLYVTVFGWLPLQSFHHDFICPVTHLYKTFTHCEMKYSLFIKCSMLSFPYCVHAFNFLLKMIFKFFFTWRILIIPDGPSQKTFCI